MKGLAWSHKLAGRSPVLVLLALLFLALAACAPAAVGTPIATTPPAVPPPGVSGDATPAPSATDNAELAKEAMALLETLPVKGKAPATGYDRRGKFGVAWLDVDHNGCDTRNDILARDLTRVVRAGPCKVLTGTLLDPYTGISINFVRGNKTSTLVQIDHRVALENAWITGAQQISQAQRESLANDPLNLVAVDGRTNSAKGSGDAATWLPPKKSYRCAYVAAQVQVKARYSLWVAPAERDAMVRVLDGCIP